MVMPVIVVAVTSSSHQKFQGIVGQVEPVVNEPACSGGGEDGGGAGGAEDEAGGFLRGSREVDDDAQAVHFLNDFLEGAE